MKKIVISIAFVLGATFAFGQELTKEELKQQQREIKALVNIAKDAEIKRYIVSGKHILERKPRAKYKFCQSVGSKA